jgi:hypothetical protein
MDLASGGESEAIAGFVAWIQAVADSDGTDSDEADSDGEDSDETGARECQRRRKKNPKRMGELSQAAFLLKARTLGFAVALPWGDSEKYDFIVSAAEGGRLLRVQVKATGRLNRGGYDVQPVYSTRGGGKKTYTVREIDVLAAHVVLEGALGKEVWYLLPVRVIAGVKSLRFFPGLRSRNPRWEGYREGWEWLRVAAKGEGK